MRNEMIFEEQFENMYYWVCEKHDLRLHHTERCPGCVIEAALR